METGNKNRCVTEATHVSLVFCKESLGNLNKCDLELFRNGSVHKFYRLKELITLEQVNTPVVEKNEES